MRALTVCGLVLVVSACGGGSGNDPPAEHARGTAALFFDGVNDRVTIPASSWGSTPLAVGLTIEAWIRPETLVVSPSYGGIVKFDTHILTLDDSYAGGDQTSFIQTVSTPTTSSATAPLGTLQTGVWQHVAGTYDGTTIRIYLNGNPVAQQSHPGTANTADNVLIGMWSTAFHGLIDEVRIWEIPRTQAEIADHMDVRLTGTEPGLLGYYRFEGTGQTVTDSSTRHANGTLGVTGASEVTDPARVAY